MKEFGQAVSIEVKNLDEAGYIEGIASSFGNVDYGNDRVLPGAFLKSLLRKPAIPMLRDHDMGKAVGRWSKATETELGLLVEGKITTKTRDGGEAYELVKDQVLEGLSIGYNAKTTKMSGKVRELVEIDLHEVSLVAIGMDPSALLTGVKGILIGGNLPTLPQFEEFLREAGFSKTQSTAIAGKGLAALIRGEPGNEPDAVEYLTALAALNRA